MARYEVAKHIKSNKIYMAISIVLLALLIYISINGVNKYREYDNYIRYERVPILR